MNPYDVLQVSPNADDLVIRAAYRSLIQRDHPDRNPGDAQAAQRAVLVTQAYELLADGERRAAYDQKSLEGHATVHNGNGLRSWSPRAGLKSAKAVPLKSPGLRLLYWLVAAAVFVCLIWTARHFMLATPTTPTGTTPEKLLADIRLQIENPKTSEADRRVLLSRKLAVLEQHEGLQKADSAMRIENMAERSLALLLEPVVVNLSPPAGMNSLTLQLSIPEITLVLGSFDTPRLRDHLLKHRLRIVQQLVQKLGSGGASVVLATDSEAALRRLIGESVMDSLDIRAQDAFASTYFESPGRYGVVGVVLPQNFLLLR